jgi:pSer/pThr/pTyr-binding forkhead associated (FHA) protein
VPTEIILLILRCISGLLLIALLITLFVIIWREYGKIAMSADLQRRTYGRLIVLREIDGQYLVTGESYALLPLTSMGRSPTNSIPINDTFASSEHAVIALRNGSWWLEDRHSRNGTLLNDLPLSQPMIITHGDIIGIGKIKFRLELEH